MASISIDSQSCWPPADRHRLKLLTHRLFLVPSRPLTNPKAANPFPRPLRREENLADVIYFTEALAGLS